MELKTHRLTVKDVTDKGTFEGYGSVFGNVDQGGDIVVKGAFAESLAAHTQKGTMPALLWQHDHKEPIGVWHEMSEDDRGLYVKGRLLVDDDPLARRAYAHLKAGSLSGLSIGFSIAKDNIDSDGVRHIEKANLWETSLVTFPMNDSARVSAVKNIIHSVRDFEALLRRCGFTQREAKALASGGWKELQRDAAGDGQQIETLINALKTRGKTK